MREPLQSKNKWWPFLATLLALSCVFSLLATPFITRYHISSNQALSIYLCFIALVIIVLAPGSKTARSFIQTHPLARHAVGVLPILCSSPYLIYAFGTGDFRWTGAAKVLAVPLFLVILYRSFPVRNIYRLSWQDGTVAAWLIGIVLSHQLNGIWTIPTNLDFMGRLFLIAVASWCWLFVRPVPELGYHLSLSLQTVRAALQNLFLFAAIAVPASIGLRFTTWNPRWSSLPHFLTELLEIFLFVALLEKLFFRGFLQSLLARTWKSSWKAQAAASCLFGLFHILHAPFPNWRYVVLATTAGWFYGSAFRQGGGLMASSLTHALVDTVWRTFFLRGS